MIERDATHYTLEDEYIRMKNISKKMMREVNRRRDNKIIQNVYGGNHARTEK